MAGAKEGKGSGQTELFRIRCCPKKLPLRSNQLVLHPGYMYPCKEKRVRLRNMSFDELSSV